MGAFLSESLTFSGKEDKLTPTAATLSDIRTGQDTAFSCAGQRSHTNPREEVPF